MHHFVLIFICIQFVLVACKEEAQITNKKSDVLIPDSTSIVLEFTMSVNAKIYQNTSYGDPPQIAIWIENTKTGEIRTVWVTYCAGENEWRGKVDCPVALPYWEYQHVLEIKASETGIADVTTGATPRAGFFKVQTWVPQSTIWNYYIEINAAGDYNQYFSYWSSDGMPDSEGNGQPSIIYKGSIRAVDTQVNTPQLIGRTDQRQPVSAIITDLSGIENARELIENIQVVSKRYSTE